MEPIISLHDVSISYKRSGNVFRHRRYYEALKSVTFDIFQGETLGILGRNGSGKSTLLRVISGIIRPDKGKIINRGVSVSLLALQAGFDPNLSGRDNAILGGMLQGYSRKEVESRLGEIQEYSELGDFFDEPVRTYSTGMRARLGFSISTMVIPDVLLIDEVLSVGDVEFRKKAERTMISKIQSQQTVILVTHSLHQISHLCDRVVLLENGTSICSDNIQDAISYYKQMK